MNAEQSLIEADLRVMLRLLRGRQPDVVKGEKRIGCCIGLTLDEIGSLAARGWRQRNGNAQSS